MIKVLEQLFELAVSEFEAPVGQVMIEVICRETTCMADVHSHERFSRRRPLDVNLGFNFLYQIRVLSCATLLQVFLWVLNLEAL